MTHRISAGAGERMQYLAHKFNDTTIRFVLHYPGHPDADTLCAAADSVIGSVDVLHASFISNSQTCHWRVNAGYPPSAFFALVECDGDPMKVAARLSTAPIGHKDLCQMHVTLVRGGGSSAVLVRISHLVVDGSDGKYLLNKLAECYRALEAGEDGVPEVKNGNRSAVNAYKELGIREIASLLKPPFSGIKTNYPFADPDAHGPLRLLRASIPAEIMERARQKAKAEGATVNDLLLTACYRAYAAVTERSGAMSISGMMDLRQHCKDGTSEGLSNMSGALSTVLQYAPEHTFSQDLAEIARQTRRAKSEPLAGLEGVPLLHAATKSFPLWVLLQAADLVYANLSLSLTNLGNIPCGPLALGGLVPTEGLFGGPLKRKPSVQVGAASFDGAAALTILGDFATEDLPSLQSFLDGMGAEIRAYSEER